MRRPPVDDLVRAALDAGDVAGAVTLALEAHGPEVFGYLVERLRDRQRAREVYAVFQEDVLRGMATFESRASVRTWVFVVARHALLRSARTRRRTQLAVPLEEAGEPVAPSSGTRTPTPLHRRTSVKDRLRALRAQLSDDDQLVLYLRVDQQMPWSELAGVMHPEVMGASEDVRRTIEARLRRRFTDLTRRLRRLAEAEGLLGDAS